MKTNHNLKTDQWANKEASHASDSLKEGYYNYSEDKIYLKMANRLKKSLKGTETLKALYCQENDEKYIPNLL